MECLNALHAKEIAETTDLKQALAVRSAQVSIKRIRDTSLEIITDIEALIDSMPLKFSRLQNFVSDFRLVFAKIISINESFRESICDQAEIFTEELLSVCESIKLLLHQNKSKKVVSNSSLKRQLEKTKELFCGVVDIIIKRKCQVSFDFNF